MNEVIAKAIVGSILKEARTEGGYAQKDIAIALGLPNANYLSMIERGTNFVPMKRIWDFANAYRLSKPQSFALLKLVSSDSWDTLLHGLKMCDVPAKAIDKLSDDVEKTIQEEARKAGVELIATEG